ncbi:NAD(P)H-hydrate dehydratase [Kineothrix sp. MB12-C1]|uniref:NAD(P)H-hydrate dehydratase n=1 Tax=Kineothrix sp. MB12-C1 TaxID=3070215 RepID=UPI0027D1EA0E|nr:NAD(P)H-hydrate dehydratase [Kineothrix sp. MB12-C1]WMC92458.1 NAD(P)H-hydrate dehydratase [Kineothrix sp. MB12-C1]
MEKRYFVSSKEMKQYDMVTIEYFQVPSMVLMERAALAVVEEVEKRFLSGSKVLIVAGSGNNGGDGIAIGRILMQRGYEVDFTLIGDRDRCSEQTSVQLTIIEKYECPLQAKIGDGEYDIIIDALFGIGLSKDVSGIYAESIEKVNSLGGFVFAVDIPSGISADTGEVKETAVKADVTVTFAYEKIGHIFYPGCEYCGEVVCKDIGITKESFRGKEPLVYSYAIDYEKKARLMTHLLPERKKSGNKGTFGKVLTIAGSRNMSGACELCVRSAYRSGAGMVKAVTPEENREIIQRNVPEALLTTYETEGREEMLLEQLRGDIEWADSIVIGPGMGKSQMAYRILSYVIGESGKPLIIDADGLNLIAESEELKAELKQSGYERNRQVILTPHVAEFARLYGCTPIQVKRDMFGKTKELARELGCVVLCKDARTIVASFKEEDLFLNTTGNDGMATAGSGDVLAGILGGLAAQGLEAFEAAKRGVFLHGMLGDMAAERMGRHALMAGDMIEQLKYITSEGRESYVC